MDVNLVPQPRPLPNYDSEANDDPEASDDRSHSNDEDEATPLQEYDIESVINSSGAKNVRSRFATCINCDEEYDVVINSVCACVGSSGC